MPPLIGEAGHTPGVWARHRALRRLVDAVAWVTWREVAIDDLDATDTGPVLLVANHFGGVSDAIVLMSVLPRRPRILADDAIWKVPVARQVMQWVGAIPVHRGHSGSTDNADMFAAAHDALADGELVLIFPEGITREEPSIGRVRSGAARIAIGAKAAGVDGIRIVPAGLHYSDKAAFRSVVYVREGQPIDLDAEIGADLDDAATDPQVSAEHEETEHEETEHEETEQEELEREEVERLTGLIAQRLRDSAPDYDDWREARALQMAAEVFLRSLEPDEPVPVGLRDRLGAWLADRPDPDRIVEVADTYRHALSQVGATDEWAAHGGARLNRRRLFTAVTWLLMVPYALMGIVAWAAPSVLTWAVSKLRLAPAVMATVLPIVALLWFGAMTGAWVWVGWERDRSSGVVTALIVLPITFAAMGLVVERGLLWARWVRNRLTTLGGRGRRLADLRAAVVAVVAEEVAAELRTGDGALPVSTGEPSLREPAPRSTAPVQDLRVGPSMAEGGA
ncbi:MAG: 1-acyl-sn-glycerol-3-phosphate acyltransferase [Microthrixaceae bacterium]